MCAFVTLQPSINTVGDDEVWSITLIEGFFVPVSGSFLLRNYFPTLGLAGGTMFKQKKKEKPRRARTGTTNVVERLKGCRVLMVLLVYLIG